MTQLEVIKVESRPHVFIFCKECADMEIDADSVTDKPRQVRIKDQSQQRRMHLQIQTEYL